MLRSVTLLLLCAAAAAEPEKELLLRQRVNKTEGFPLVDAIKDSLHREKNGPMNGPTLREWMQQPGSCFNLAIAPLRSSQPALLGLADAFKEEGMLRNCKGIAGVSSSSLAGAVMAHGGSGKKYVDMWKGWHTFGNTDEGMTTGFHKHMTEHLPEEFHELKIPLATSATAWPTEYDAYAKNTKKARVLVSTKGGLHEAIIASSAAMSGPGCPDCTFGFKAKKHEGHYPVSDGAQADPDGTAGLVKLPKCDRVVHLWMTDYDGQLPHPKIQEIPGKPEHLVTLEVNQPPSATYAHGATDSSFAHGELSWNKQMYAATHEAILSALDRPMEVKSKNHFVAHTDVPERVRSWQTPREEQYNERSGFRRKLFWQTTAVKRSGVLDYLEPAVAAKEM